MPDTAQLLPPQARLLQLYSGLAMCIVRAVAETLMAMPLAVCLVRSVGMNRNDRMVDEASIQARSRSGCALP